MHGRCSNRALSNDGFVGFKMSVPPERLKQRVIVFGSASAIPTQSGIHQEQQFGARHAHSAEIINDKAQFLHESNEPMASNKAAIVRPSTFVSNCLEKMPIINIE